MIVMASEEQRRKVREAVASLRAARRRLRVCRNGEEHGRIFKGGRCETCWEKHYAEVVAVRARKRAERLESAETSSPPTDSATRPDPRGETAPALPEPALIAGAAGDQADTTPAAPETVRELIDRGRAAGHDALGIANDAEALEVLEQIAQRDPKPDNGGDHG